MVICCADGVISIAGDLVGRVVRAGDIANGVVENLGFEPARLAQFFGDPRGSQFPIDLGWIGGVRYFYFSGSSLVNCEAMLPRASWGKPAFHFS